MRARRAPLHRDWAPWLIVGLVAALALPYALAGPRLLIDDWHFLRNAHFDGIFAAGGGRQLIARPVAWLIYAVQFGVIGRHPMVLYVLQTAANAGVAVALFCLARRFLARDVALGVAVAWVLLPNHSSLSRWFATLPAVLGLLLVILGALLLDRELPWPAISCFAVAALTYEALIPVAGFALISVTLLRRRRIGAEVLAGLLVLACITQWVWTHRIYPVTVPADFTRLLPIHFGSGIASGRPAAALLSVIAGIAVTGALVRLALPSFRARTGFPERLVLAGVLVIGVGSVAFFRWPWIVTGMNDRANVVGSIGAAMVWVAIGLMLARIRRSLAVAGAVLAILLVLPAHHQRDLDYRAAANDAERVLTTAARAPVGLGREIVLDPSEIKSHHETYGLFDWMVSSAVQLRRDDPTVTARFALRRVK
jgi:hypothetical protein